MNKMIDLLKQFGLSEYGSKAYIYLVQNPGITAYKLSELSSVPNSKIYESLNKLEEQGLVYYNLQNQKKFYYAISPKQTVELFEKKQNNALLQLEEEMDKLNISNQNDAIQIEVLTNSSNIYSNISEAVKTAKKQITVSIWPDIYEVIDKNAHKDIHIQGMTFQVDKPGHDLINHRYTNYVQSSLTLKPFIVIIDNQYMIYGQTPDDDMRAYISRDSTQIKMMKDYIWHDVLVNLYISKFEENIEDEITLKRKRFFS
ncbi:TrmB family transcriptional regulator [Staphylococcus lentus]|uniref:TrmB family transcriptional regulator n=1 Tax=Mammaliicoccus TaxID=2803850 RepID=UPI001884324E|nr:MULTISPECIES: TrmB family transcriptional regulator [Mammaliicoccus]MBF0842904.1 TrmB family transcriptional regulator [Mammaliicoccus lentus]